MIAAGVIVLSLIGLWILDAVVIHLRYSLLDTRAATGRGGGGRERLGQEAFHFISLIPTKILVKQRLRVLSLSLSPEACPPGLSRDLGFKNRNLYSSEIFTGSLRHQAGIRIADLRFGRNDLMPPSSGSIASSPS